MKPQKLNQKAAAIMDKLTDGLVKPGDNATFDYHNYTEHWDGGIMAAHVEHIGYFEGARGYPLFSVAHYYKQNGDMMRDPDMVFMKHDNGGFYPTSFEQSNMGLYQESLYYKDGCMMLAPRMQRDHKDFANQWMINIKQQQGL